MIEKIYVKIPASMKLHECLEVTKNFFFKGEIWNEVQNLVLMIGE